MARKFLSHYFVYFGIWNMVFMVHFYKFILDNTQLLRIFEAKIYFSVVVVMHLLPAFILTLLVFSSGFIGAGKQITENLHKTIVVSPFAIIPLWGLIRYFSTNPAYLVPLTVIIFFFLSIIGLRFYKSLNELYKVIGYLSLVYVCYFIFHFYSLETPKPYVGDGPVHPVSAETNEKQHPPTIVILFDEFALEAVLNDQNEISNEFPSLKMLARESLWFKHGATNYDSTRTAVPSMLNGKLIIHNDEWIMRDNFRTKPNLFNIAASVYDVEVLGTSIGYCPGVHDIACRDENDFYPYHPLDISIVLTEVFLQRSKFLPDKIKHRVQFSFNPYMKWQEKKITSMINKKNLTNRLIFFHTMLPHSPYMFRRDGSVRAFPEYFSFHHITADKEKIDIVLKLYKDQLVYMDSFIGRIVKKLKENGNWNRINFVITSDHGVSWEIDTPYRGDGFVNDQVARVPMFIKPAGLKKGETREDYYQHINFLPTMLDMMNLVPPKGLQGYSVLKERKNLPLFTSSGNQWWKKDSPQGEWKKIDAKEVLETVPGKGSH